MMEQQWEESEKILSWRDMHQGVYRYHGIEHRGTNDYGRPISVVTLESEKRREHVLCARVFVLGSEAPARNKLHKI